MFQVSLKDGQNNLKIHPPCVQPVQLSIMSLATLQWCRWGCAEGNSEVQSKQGERWNETSTRQEVKYGEPIEESDDSAKFKYIRLGLRGNVTNLCMPTTSNYAKTDWRFFAKNTILTWTIEHAETTQISRILMNRGPSPSSHSRCQQINVTKTNLNF